MNNFGFRAFVANYNDGKLSPDSIVQARKILFKGGMFYKFQKKSNLPVSYKTGLLEKISFPGIYSKPGTRHLSPL